MTKPTPDDYLNFFVHLVKNKGKDFEPEILAQVGSDDPGSRAFDEAFFSTFPAKQTDQEIFKAADFDQFLEEHDLDMKVGDLCLQQSKQIKERRKMLLRVLTLLECAKKAKEIPEYTTLLSLFKWISNEAQKLNRPDKKTFNVKEAETIYFLKVLVELRAEGMDDSATVPDIIKALNGKYEALKGIV
jgi:hypothetical protein